ncbi:MAG: hypothetical protein HY437_00450 [Candidatus Magasanikbacteria bacterium]|nr:hypothetical protein [Candidatus Magasanikbacteria bacterium]
MKVVLCMAMMGIGIMGLVAGCGEDAAPGSANGGSDGNEGEGEGSPLPGEGEGQGAGEGAGARPPGADGELCGGPSGNACKDGFQCGAETEEPGICTCPQWMEGTWWAEFPEVRRTDGQEYDFRADGHDVQFWTAHEVTFRQEGCNIFKQEGCSTRGSSWECLWSGDGLNSEGHVEPPKTFIYERKWGDLDGNNNHLLRSTGQISENGQNVQGTCAGEYRNWNDFTLFPISCTFTLTRR